MGLGHQALGSSETRVALPCPGPAGPPPALGRILIIDDDPFALTALKAMLESRHYVVATAPDGAEGLARITALAPDLVITPLDLPRIDGHTLVQRLNAAHPGLPVIGVTRTAGPASAAGAMRLGAADVVTGPIDLDVLTVAMERAIQQGRVRGEIARLRAEAERADRSMRALLAHLPDALITADASGQIQFLNEEAERILRTHSATAVGRHLRDFFPTLTLDEPRLEGDAFVPLAELTVDDRFYAPAIRRMVIEGASLLVVTLRDVTEKRRLDNRRLDFYSMVAHDLRSPLAAISLRIGKMQQDLGDAPEARFGRDLELIEVRIGELVTMINDFLDIARSENVGLTLTPRRFDLVGLARACVDEHAHLAALAGVTMHLEEPRPPIGIVADPARIKQVLGNLLSNAIKFSPPGGEVRVDVQEHAHDVELAVSDTGRGIAEDKLADLFKRYSRPGAETVTGTGLGLMIVREILQAHAGTMGVVSRLGAGSRFWVRLPRG